MHSGSHWVPGAGMKEGKGIVTDSMLQNQEFGLGLQEKQCVNYTSRWMIN
jgi:hypothetical protein